jgi:hypothetical protein
MYSRNFLAYALTFIQELASSFQGELEYQLTSKFIYYLLEVYILSPRSPYISLFTKIFGEQVSIGRLDMPLVTIVQGV